MPMFDFVENNFDSLLRHVEQYYDFKQILVKVCSRASYARDQIASKIRASCEQDLIISRADREHTCARDRDLIASKCTYDSEPHCTSIFKLALFCEGFAPQGPHSHILMTGVRQRFILSELQNFSIQKISTFLAYLEPFHH